ncbi:LysM peptidoglycan-binding domain-containing protein [Coraliomargarita sinensis]|nr:LysM domain-containing protein [Coraliomargarita sinensis]
MNKQIRNIAIVLPTVLSMISCGTTDFSSSRAKKEAKEEAFVETPLHEGVYRSVPNAGVPSRSHPNVHFGPFLKPDPNLDHSTDAEYPKKGIVYHVTDDDTLASIASAQNSRISWIIQANRLQNPYSLKEGEPIFVPLENQSPTSRSRTTR